MMDRRERNISKFLECVGEARLWHSYDARFTALRVEGSWLNLYTQITLKHATPENLEALGELPQLTDLACWQTIDSIQTLPDLVNSLSSGSHTVNGEEVLFTRDRFEPGRGERSYTDSSCEFYRRDWHFRPLKCQWGYLWLRLGGDQVSSLMQQIVGGHGRLDEELQKYHRPFEDLNALLQEFQGVGEVVSAASIDVVAPVEVAFGEPVDLNQGRLDVPLVAGHDLTRQRIEIALMPKGLMSEDRKVIDDISWSIDGAVWHGTTSTRTDPSLKELKVMLRVAGIPWDAALVRNMPVVNPAWAAHALFDPKLIGLVKSLSQDHPTTKEYAKSFERAVACILHLVGFRVDLVDGAPGTQNVMDLLAFADAMRWVLVVECTTKGLGYKGKLTTLTDRHQQVREAIPGFDVQGVMVTRSSRRELSEQEQRQASASGIWVLTLEDLLELCDLAEQGPDLKDVASYLRQRGQAYDHDGFSMRPGVR